MSEDDEPGAAAANGARGGYDVGRLLAFSDGVFAIAITLLVLGIPVPSHGGPLLPGELLGLLPNLGGFALSFLLVGTQWIAHHRLLRRLDFCTAPILWLNLLLLMGICLVPFATSLLIRYGGTPAGAITYATLQAAIGIVFMSLRLYLVHHGVDLRRTLALSWIPVVSFVVSIPVALLDVNLAYAVWVLGFAVSRVREGGLATRAFERLRHLARRT